MTDDPQMSGVDLGRWLVIGLVIAGCLGLYLWLAPETPPVVNPEVLEASP